MRRLVFTSDDGEHTGEIGLDNEGNLYLRGAVGQSIRLLQETSSEGDYSPDASNLQNVASIAFENGGFAVLGKQVLVVLAFTKDVQDGFNQSEFEVSLPFPPAFTGDDSEAAAMFCQTGGPGAGKNPSFVVTPVAGTRRVNINILANEFLTGPFKYQLGFCYRIP